MKKIWLFLLISACLGILYRWELSSLFPHEPIADEITYVKLAHDIGKSGLVAECCSRGYIYPMFLSIFFGLFGTNNFAPIILAQAWIDTMTGVLLFFISERVFGKRIWSCTIYILYLINPLTSSYTGLFLTEILAFFSLVLFLYLFFTQKGFTGTVLAGLALGAAMYNRLMFFYWAIGVVIITGLFIYFWNKKISRAIKSMAILTLGVVIMSAYPVAANWKMYRLLSPLPPIPWIYSDFLNSMVLEKMPALLPEYYTYAAPVITGSEYAFPVTSKDAFMKVVESRMIPVVDFIKTHPFDFLYTRVRHIPFFWDKSNLFFYHDPFFPGDRIIVRIINSIFLFISGFGLAVSFGKKKLNKKATYLSVFTLFLVIYITGVLSLRIPEERHTIPAYPFLLLFFPMGISFFIQRQKHP